MARKILCILLVSISALVFFLFPLKSDQTLSARSMKDESATAEEFVVGDLVISEYGLNFDLRGGEIVLDHDNQLIAPGLNGRTQEPGAPSLPFYSTWIILPPWRRHRCNREPARLVGIGNFRTNAGRAR